MIISDARHILELLKQIEALNKAMEPLSEKSGIARLLGTIPGFGKTSIAELAGEIGTLERFDSEAGLALYLGMCPLDNQSGQFHGTKSPRQVNRRGDWGQVLQSNIRLSEAKCGTSGTQAGTVFACL